MSPPLTTPTTGRRPLAIRGYATLVVALAAFLGSMVVWRVPFRGYLVEARLAGRLGDGLDRQAVEKWLTSAASDVNVRIDADEGGRCDIVLQQIAPRAADAQIAIDRMTRQFAEQFVAQRREASRQIKLSRLQAELQTARDTEDALRTRVDLLRQQQLAGAAPAQPSAELATPQAPAATPSPLAADDKRTTRLRQRLEALHVELATAIGNFTEAHPKVITLRSQIAGLESELAAGISPAVSADSGFHEPSPRRSSHGVSYLSATDYELTPSAMESATANLAAATRARQWAERQLQTEVETLASAAGFPWSVESARVLTRVGGTPRMLTLTAAGLVTVLAAGLMIWASAVLVPRLFIQTTDELAALLAVPLVGRASALGRRTVRRPPVGPWVVQGALHGAEVLLAAMFVALAFTMISDRWLAGQVLADPFGVLSEVAGRLLG